MPKTRKILKRRDHLVLVGFSSGEFLRLRQGTANPSAILHRWQAAPGHEYFEVFDEEPHCDWGSGVYRVRDDNSLQTIKQDYDSSD